jgi:glutamate racemase
MAGQAALKPCTSTTPISPQKHASIWRHCSPPAPTRSFLAVRTIAFLRPVLEPLVANRATLVDVADAVARQCVRLAGAGTSSGGRLALFATAHPERLQAALPVLGLGRLCDRQTQAARLAIA